MYDVFEIWVKFTEKFQQSINEGIYNAWIKPIIPVEVNDQYFKVAVKTPFFKKMLEEKYSEIIESEISNIMGTNVKLIVETLQTDTEMPSPSDSPQEEKYTSPVQQTVFDELDKAELKSNLNPKYIFENFIVGNSNRMAFAAASRVADNPAFSYNPLFIYGGSGLGKTHLMHAIGNRILNNNPNMRILYISCESFTNEIINSIMKKTTDSFRQKYRNIDCLIIDDIQFLKGKEQTQVEFFHTFNALHDANKQIIISSDRPPKEIETLEDRLRTRFEWGLQADIQPPDLETRIAIIRQKAGNENIELPNDVVTLLATNITTNIREIEGAYTKLIAFSSILNLPITIATAQKVLDDMKIDTVAHMVTLDKIVTTVSDYYNVKIEELYNQKRTRRIAYPRQIAMYLCRELADLSYPKIGEQFGGRDHTTVIHAYEKISNDLNTDLQLKEDIARISERIKQ